MVKFDTQDYNVNAGKDGGNSLRKGEPETWNIPSEAVEIMWEFVTSDEDPEEAATSLICFVERLLEARYARTSFPTHRE